MKTFVHFSVKTNSTSNHTDYFLVHGTLLAEDERAAAALCDASISPARSLVYSSYTKLLDKQWLLVKKEADGWDSVLAEVENNE